MGAAKRTMTVISTPPKSFDTIGVFSSFVADQERYTASPRKVWRRAGDSNSETPCGVVDFKSTALPVEASPPGPARQELTIHHQAIRTMSPPCKLVTG